jgi:hypothetical protein
MRNTFVALLSVVLIGGCASVDSPADYVLPESADVAHLILGRLNRSALTHWDKFELRAVDDLFVQRGHLTIDTRVPVTPGEHRILVEGSFARGIGGGIYSTFIPLRFEFRPKGEYKLNGVVRDNLIEVWVEEKTSGQRVSQAFSAPFAAVRQAPPVPIFVPVR